MRGIFGIPRLTVIGNRFLTVRFARELLVSETEFLFGDDDLVGGHFCGSLGVVVPCPFFVQRVVSSDLCISKKTR